MFARGAVDQPLAQARFQRAHVVGNHGRRKRSLLGDRSEAAQIGDRHEDRHAGEQVHSTPRLSRVPIHGPFLRDSKVCMQEHMKSLASFFALALFVTLVGSAPAAPPARVPELLPLPVDWYPESLAVSDQGVFYVGSWRQGRRRPHQTGASKPEVLVPPGSNGLANGQGMLVDAARRLLWVCSGSMGFTTVPTTPSALKSYDLESGAPRGSYVMPEQGYCNDLAQDKRGTLYVTDSLHPRILRLDLSGGMLVIWKESPAFGHRATNIFSMASRSTLSSACT